MLWFDCVGEMYNQDCLQLLWLCFQRMMPQRANGGGRGRTEVHQRSPEKHFHFERRLVLRMTVDSIFTWQMSVGNFIWNIGNISRAKTASSLFFFYSDWRTQKRFKGNYQKLDPFFDSKRQLLSGKMRFLRDFKNWNFPFSQTFQVDFKDYTTDSLLT